MESVDSASYGERNAISWLNNMLQGSGFVDSTARPASLALLKQYISGQTIVSAFNDTFWLLFVIFLFVVIPVLVIKKRVRTAEAEGSG